MKHLEETPWFICDKEDENYCAYVDTESNYYNAEPILKYLYPNFESFSDKDKDDKLEQRRKGAKMMYDMMDKFESKVA